MPDTVTLPTPRDETERVYHDFPGSKYMIPSDKEEEDRLLLQHQLIKEFDKGKLILAPYAPRAGDTILDIGTAAGEWLKDVAEIIPADVSLTGADIQDKLWDAAEISSMYPNMTFQKCSVLSLPPEWTSKFDFVHQRLLIAGLVGSEWPQAISEVYRVAKPGSYVQLTEMNKIEGGPCTKRFQSIKEELYHRIGLLPDCVEQIPKMLQEQGFLDIKMISREFPLGLNGGKLGEMAKGNYTSLYRAMKITFVKNGFKKEEIDRIVAEMEKEWSERSDCFAYKTTFIARKPV